jgi:hypothetical protein
MRFGPACIRQHTSAYARIRQHTSAYVSIRQSPQSVCPLRHAFCYCSRPQHTSAYVSIRQHTSAYVSHLKAYALFDMLFVTALVRKLLLPVRGPLEKLVLQCVSIRQHTSAYFSIRQHTSASSFCQFVGRSKTCTAVRQHTSAYFSIRQHTSAYVRKLLLPVRGPLEKLVLQCAHHSAYLKPYLKKSSKKKDIKQGGKNNTGRGS